jgi:hypothetical protein
LETLLIVLAISFTSLSLPPNNPPKSGTEKPNRLRLAAVARALSISTSSFDAMAWLTAAAWRS